MSDFKQPPNLNDPYQLIAACTELGQGMERQAESASGAGAMSGHPYPSFFYSQVALALQAAAKYIASVTGPKEDDKPSKAPSKPKKEEVKV